MRLELREMEKPLKLQQQEHKAQPQGPPERTEKRMLQTWARMFSVMSDRLWALLSIHFAFIHPAILPSYIWLSDHCLMNHYAGLCGRPCKQKQREEAYPHSQGPCKLTRETNKPSLQEKCRALWVWILQEPSSAGWPEIVWLWKWHSCRALESE